MAQQHECGVMRELDELLKSVSALHGAVLVAELTSGPVSQSYLLSIAGKQLVLRVDSALVATLGLDRHRELAILQLVGQTGLAPQMYWADPEQGLLITEYVSGGVLPLAEITKTDNIQQLAGVLRRLHRLPVDPVWPSLIDVLNHYRLGLRDNQPRKLADQAISLASELGFGDRLGSVFCHGDVHVGNIKAADGWCLLDWEYAGKGHAYFDLATFAVQHVLSEVQIEMLLQAYDPRVDQASIRLFSQYCDLYLMVAEIWGLLVVEKC